MSTSSTSASTPPGRVGMVCFDLGGVIVKHHRAWRDACAAVGLELRPGIEDPALVARRRELTALYHVGRLGCDEFFSALADATNALYTRDEVRRLHDAWIYAEYEGIADVLHDLVRADRARTGVLSNTNASHWARVGPAPAGAALPYFPAAAVLGHRHASHLLGLAKPDPAIYRAFERETGARGPEILFFDDLPENVAAAAALGWRTVLVDHLGDTASQVRLALRRHDLLD
ncbi:MAG: HAD-IA family hydrolase [Planctomycetota bacterium]|nr:HAD-IA family hydrolase [Planctomycetota bacterium]